MAARELIAEGVLAGDFSWEHYDTGTLYLLKDKTQIFSIQNIKDGLEDTYIPLLMEGARELYEAPQVFDPFQVGNRKILPVNFCLRRMDEDKNVVGRATLEAIYSEDSPYTPAEQLLILVSSVGMGVHLTPERMALLEGNLLRLHDFSPETIPWGSRFKEWLLPEFALYNHPEGPWISSAEPDREKKTTFINFAQYLTYLRLGDFLASSSTEPFEVWAEQQPGVEGAMIPRENINGIRTLLLDNAQRGFLRLNSPQLSQLSRAVDSDTVAVSDFLAQRILEGIYPAVCEPNFAKPEKLRRGGSYMISGEEASRILTVEEYDSLRTHLEAEGRSTLARLARADLRACLGILVLVAQFGVGYAETLLETIPEEQYIRAARKNKYLREFASLSNFHEPSMPAHLLLAFSNLDVELQRTYGKYT